MDIEVDRYNSIIPSKWSLQPTPEQIEKGTIDEWLTFPELWLNGREARLQDEELDIFTKQFVRLANEVIQRAEIVIATPAMVASEMTKAKKFNDVINDETSMTTALEVLMAWRSNKNIILIGDDLQLASPVYIVAVENLFFKTLGISMFARYRDLYMPAFLLNGQMRMPAGMMHLSNDIIYQEKLRYKMGKVQRLMNFQRPEHSTSISATSILRLRLSQKS